MEHESHCHNMQKTDVGTALRCDLRGSGARPNGLPLSCAAPIDREGGCLLPAFKNAPILCPRSGVSLSGLLGRAPIDGVQPSTDPEIDCIRTPRAIRVWHKRWYAPLPASDHRLGLARGPTVWHSVRRERAAWDHLKNTPISRAKRSTATTKVHSLG